MHGSIHLHTTMVLWKTSWIGVILNVYKQASSLLMFHPNKRWFFSTFAGVLKSWNLFNKCEVIQNIHNSTSLTPVTCANVEYWSHFDQSGDPWSPGDLLSWNQSGQKVSKYQYLTPLTGWWNSVCSWALYITWKYVTFMLPCFPQQMTGDLYCENMFLWAEAVITTQTWND